MKAIKKQPVVEFWTTNEIKNMELFELFGKIDEETNMMTIGDIVIHADDLLVKENGVFKAVDINEFFSNYEIQTPITYNPCDITFVPCNTDNTSVDTTSTITWTGQIL